MQVSPNAKSVDGFAVNDVPLPESEYAWEPLVVHPIVMAEGATVTGSLKVRATLLLGWTSVALRAGEMLMTAGADSAPSATCHPNPSRVLLGNPVHSAAGLKALDGSVSPARTAD